MLTSREGAVLTITLNRPEVFNAFNAALHAAFRAALEEAAGADVRAVVITGAGKGFCAGQDLKEFQEMPESIRERLEQTYHPNIRLIRGLEKPVIAAVNGPCAGAGLSLAAACDIRIAADAATFVPGFIGIGLIPDSGGSWFIHRLLGFARAFEWMTSNRRLTAAEAHAWGLVSEVVEADRFAGAHGGVRGELRRAADAGDRDDETALRPCLHRVARRAARARGRAPAGCDRKRRLRRGRRRVPREAAAALQRQLAASQRTSARISSSSGKRPCSCFEKTSLPSESTSYWLFSPGVIEAAIPLPFSTAARLAARRSYPSQTGQ